MNKLEFQTENHRYTLNGKPIISVTKAIRLLLGDKYEYVSEDVLQRAAEHGTRIHNLIESVESGYIPHSEELTKVEEQILEDYTRIKKFKSNEIELKVNYKNIYAGTIDGVGDDIIYDIKTTATVDYLYVSMQLSLYLLAYDYKRYNKYKAYCLHFPKNDRAKKIQIELFSKKEILEIVEKIKLLEVE